MWIKLTCVSVCLGILLTACGDENVPGVLPPAEQTAPVSSTPDTDTAVSYRTYCFEQVGQVQAEPRRGDVCNVHAGGTGGGRVDPDRPMRNLAMLHLSAPSLEAIGMDGMSFILNRGDKDPKFPIGVQVVDQEKMKFNPNRQIQGYDKTGENSFFTLTKPDADFLRSELAPEHLAGYEIATGVLTINDAVDVPLREGEQEMARLSNQIHGSQFIEGTLTLSFIPMRSDGQKYGPTTFEFRTEVSWGVLK